MTTRARRRSTAVLPLRRLALAALVSLVSLVSIAGCAASAPEPSPSATPSPAPSASASAAPTPADGPIVTIERRGGRCADGPCDETTFVDGTGLVHMAAKPPNELGTLSPVDLVALEAAILTTDFNELRSHPFTGDCPTAFDGQEIVLTFATGHGDERLASCETALDGSWPVLAALTTALAQIAPLSPFGEAP